MMATIQELEQALVEADRQGNTADAQKLAVAIYTRRQQTPMMATIQELEQALVEADRQGNTADAQKLAVAIYTRRQQTPHKAIPYSQQGGDVVAPMPGSALPVPIQAGVIGAGRTGNQIVAGAKELGLSTLAAVKAIRGDAGEELRSLAQLEQEQKSDQPIYNGLRRQFPMATALGEAAPYAGIPIGQAGAIGRLMAPAVGMGALEALKYGSPRERAAHGAVGFGSGAAGGMLAELIARGIMPVANAASSTAQQAARQAAKKIGAPLLPSQLSGSPTLARVEDSLARAPISAGVMQDVISKQKEAMGRAAASAIGETESAIPQVVLDAAKARMGGQYDQFRAQIPNGLPANQEAFDAIARAEKMLSTGLKTNDKSGALTLLADLKEKLYNAKALSPEDYAAVVSDLAHAARETKNQTVRAALKNVGGKLDEIARGPLNDQWRELDRSYAAAKTLEKSNALNPTTGEIERPRTLANYMKNHPSGANATSLADVKAFAEAVPLLRAGSPTFERGEVGYSGLLNALWRYPLAKGLTSDVMRDYLSEGLFANPEVSALLAAMASRTAVPAGAAPAGLLGSPPLLSQ